MTSCCPEYLYPYVDAFRINDAVLGNLANTKGVALGDFVGVDAPEKFKDPAILSPCYFISTTVFYDRDNPRTLDPKRCQFETNDNSDSVRRL